MEEACSFWGRKVAWRCFVAAILAAFTLTVCSQYGDRGVVTFTNIYPLGNIDMLRQCPFIVAVAGVGGLLGALFNSMRRAIWPLRASRSRRFLRMAEALAVAALSVTAQFVSSHVWGKCVERPSTWPPETEFKACSIGSALLRAHSCDTSGMFIKRWRPFAAFNYCSDLVHTPVT
jgi:chloride channel 7